MNSPSNTSFSNEIKTESTNETIELLSEAPEAIDLKTSSKYIAEGEWQKALDCCKQIVKLEPNSWQAYQQMGEILINLKRWKDAIAAYNYSLEIDGDLVLSYAKLGLAYGQLQQWVEVDSCYQKVDELNADFWHNFSDNHEIHHKLGDNFFRKKLWHEATVAYRRALKIDSNAYWSNANLGRSLMQLSSWQEATIYLYRALEIDPDKVDTYYYLGEALIFQEIWAEAIEIYDRAKQLDSNSSLIVAKFQEIAASLEQQIELNCDLAENYYLLGEVYTQLARWGKAINAYDKAYKSNFYNENIQEKVDYAIAQQEKNQLGGIGDYLFGDLTPDNPFLARITNIELGGIVTGWAIDNDNPEQSLKVQIRIDNHLITTVETGEICREVMREELNHHPRKFQFSIPFLLAQKLLLDDELHVIELIPLSKPEGRLQPIVAEIVIPRKGIGRIDTHTNNFIKGWALPDGHTGTANLDIYLDDLFYTTIRANLSRQDLVKYGLGNGNSGFEIELPYFLSNNEQLKVDITFSNTQQKLHKKSILLELSDGEQPKQDRDPRGQLSFISRDVSKQKDDLRTTIIVPIYNAHDEVRACIESVVRETSSNARLLLINDASTDERIPSLLKWASTYSNVHIINNENNLGYTKTINLGIKWAGNDDIILLNSDTIVGLRWLQNLQIAAYHDIDIATVTAMSDNAGAFSVPTMGRANELPKWLTFGELTRAIAHNCENVYPDVPTGNGFCLYIRRAVFDRIGLFDEVTFPRGYGEENDFCMRALAAGWRHIIDDRTLVRHVRSASFKGEKTALYEAGGKAILERYPAYKSFTQTFSTSSNLQEVRYKIRKLIEKGSNLQKRVLPRVLYVISTQTGGTPQTNEDLMNGLSDRYHPFLLQCNSKEITLYDCSSQSPTICEQIKLNAPIKPESYRSREYDEIVSSILVRYGIELLHIRHIAWHSLSLPRLAKHINIPVVFSFHDFYTICPTVNLLDENSVFCGGRCTAGEGECNVGVWNNKLPKLKHHFIKTWQEMMADMFQYVDAFVTTSDSAKNQIEEIYPNLKNSPFSIIPHGRDFPQLSANTAIYEQFLHPSQPLRILFPGNVGTSKGSELIAQIQALDVEKRIEFHFLGKIDPILASVGKHHGTYKRNEYHKWIQKIQPHYVGIFSIWPETYCHTLTESWASGVPVIAIDKGAVGDRIRQHGGGLLIDSTDPKVIYDRLLKVANDVDGYWQKIGEVRSWQRFYGKQNNIATMSAKYCQLYQQTSANNLSFREKEDTKQCLKLGAIVRRDRYGNATPSVHIRVLEWLNHPEIGKTIDPQFLDIDSFLQDKDGVFDLDAILVQRNAVEPYLVESFITACRQRQLSIVFELDDDLLNVPAEKDFDGAYTRNAHAIQKMVTAATLVIVSTEPLAEKMRSLNSNVAIVPNTISEFAWLRPIEPCQDLPISLLQEKSNTLKILYMGNPTHTEDLAMVRPVFENLQEEGHPVELFVIGGEPEVNEREDAWYQRLTIPVERRHYPQFVDWFRGVASYCDLAIAPLVDNNFNRSKSALKFLQYSILGLPSICSDCPPYSNIVRDGVTGMLVDNTIKAWKNAILECLNNGDRLQELGQAAKTEILDRHLMSHYADIYCQLFIGSSIGRSHNIKFG
jgi:GT2 family glycosyltransferase/glycosyltransferase involved in cell wall biosynthesis/tetratricopeptide (TPR) repeat protein